MKRCEKAPAKDKNLPLEPIVATRQVRRPPEMHAAFPTGDLPSPRFSLIVGGQPLATPVAAASLSRKHRRKKSRPARSTDSVGYK